MKPASSTGRAPTVVAGTTSPLSVTAASVELTILGALPSMKNSRRIVRNPKTGKRLSIKSAKSLSYAMTFGLQVPPEARKSLGGPEQPLKAIVSVFYPSLRSDLDCAAVYDLLQQCGVVSNDRWIREHLEYAHVDPINPRVEILIEEL
jgi:Holliday junction resolvase RusA-like endonuclease